MVVDAYGSLPATQEESCSYPLFPKQQLLKKGPSDGWLQGTLSSLMQAIEKVSEEMREMKREAKPETEYEKLVAAAMERLQAVEEKQQQMQNALSSGISCITEMSSAIQKDMKTILSTVRREDTNRKKSNEQLEKKLLAVVKKENDALCERMSSLQRIADIDSTVVRSKRGRHRAADPWEHKRREMGDGSTQQPSQELIVAAADRNLFWVE
ncbi:hypothetical protein WA556_002699, partial [Blastocystis sp. ATCC 50177/Nand II]